MVAISRTTTASMVRIPKLLQGQQQQHVQAGDDDRPEQRDMEQQVEGHRTSQHLRQIAGADGHLAHQPVGPARPPRIPVAAALRQILAGHHAQPGGDHLHEDGHQAGQPDHPQQPVLELSAALQVGSPVAGVHVADADQNRRPDEGPPLLPEAGLGGAAPRRCCASPPATRWPSVPVPSGRTSCGLRDAWGFVFKASPRKEAAARLVAVDSTSLAEVYRIH